MAENKGLVHIYHGNGKGKTTCSVGLSVRASGTGKKVLFLQFMKTGKSSEISVLEGIPEIDVMYAPRMKKFSFSMSDEEKAGMKEENEAFLEQVSDRIGSGGYDLLVMDECIGAIHKGMLDERMILSLLDSRPEGLEVVMTGRHPSDALLERADYVTEMKKEKHPYDEGIKARRGIEF